MFREVFTLEVKEVLRQRQQADSCARSHAGWAWTGRRSVATWR